jgi:hypothetical protein
MNVNIWDVNDAIQALVRGGQRVDKNALRDPQTHFNRSPAPDGGRSGPEDDLAAGVSLG